MPDRPPSSAGPLTSRPGRLALVARDLADLRGPTSGWVELPHRLVWLPAPSRRFNLDDEYDRMKVYEIVLREAVQYAELNTWLNAELLRSLWPELYLPKGVRRAWEIRYPELALLRTVA